MSDNKTVTFDALIEYLKHTRGNHESSIAARDPIIAAHIKDLSEWIDALAAPTPAAQSADRFRQMADMVDHSGDATEKVAAQSAGQEAVAWAIECELRGGGVLEEVYLSKKHAQVDADPKKWIDGAKPSVVPLFRQAAPANGGERAADAPQVGGDAWPMLSDMHLLAITLAYNEGYSKAYDGREFENPFAQTGSQAAAWELGTRDGKEARKAALTSPAKVGGDEREAYIASLPADWHEDSSLETWFPLTAEELAATKGMFGEACADLGRVNEALGLDPDDAGAEPILDAIEELKARTALSADGGEPHREAKVGPLIYEACGSLPEGWRVRIEFENGYGGVVLVDPYDEERDMRADRDAPTIAEQLHEAINAAIAAKAKGDAS